MSKFDKVFEAREESEQEKQNDKEKSPVKTTKADKTASKPAKKTSPKAIEASTDGTFETQATETSKSGKQRGRPKAKRSDPDFIGFTTYIRKDTHLNVKIALLQEGKGREMSELVEDLLSGWIKKR